MTDGQAFYRRIEHAQKDAIRLLRVSALAGKDRLWFSLMYP
jgi:hypothetical protein